MHMKDIVWKKYEIHKAAGTFFLVNTAQKGDVFEKPVEVNEFGALVINLIKEGKSIDEAAKLLSEALLFLFIQLYFDLTSKCNKSRFA